jgi:hypothetical protein
MPETNLATVTVEILGSIMDEPARQIGTMKPGQIETMNPVCLRTQTSRAMLEKADELAHELARLKIGDRQRIEILKKFAFYAVNETTPRLFSSNRDAL